ncbi:hypothetical protein PCYB_004620 [Plasmodium cynomolgi strain B]|uniref:Pv-fam-d protein n=1 Tax=Plasmodium cynomolgi (strain B) TaxID=1120755 RepID=K6UNQ7_PLACD|nr:hypothetical protein PCYB_004620 [Plasmodium cynomolgi strain B]GAB69713.1 hypothetical protein PCYB_004620 [Plasmodium cynomolgi strain B]
MISLAKLSIFIFVMCSWQYPNYVTELVTSWGNGTSQNDTLDVRISRSLKGETDIETGQQNKFSANSSGAFLKNTELGKESRKLDSMVELKKLSDIKNKAEDERMEIKSKGFSNESEYSRRKKKENLFLFLAYSVPYPLALYCVYLIVVSSNSVPYSWVTCGIAIPAFIGFVLLFLFLVSYYPFKRIKNIK